ncbi:hypothetical protein D3C71_1729420 [compost metagenome]
MGSSLPQCHLVVDAETNRRQRRNASQQLRVRHRAHKANALPPRRSCGHRDDARNARGHQLFDMSELDFAIIVVYRQDQAVALRIAAFRQRLGDGGVEIVGDVRKQQTDQFTRAATHYPGRRVTYITQLLGGLSYPRLGFGADARIVRHRSADSGYRDSQLFRHLFRRDH